MLLSMSLCGKSTSNRIMIVRSGMRPFFKDIINILRRVNVATHCDKLH